MPPTPWKLRSSEPMKEGRNPAAPRDIWYAPGYADSDAAVAAVLAASPLNIGPLQRKNWTPREIAPGSHNWEVALEYAVPVFGDGSDAVIGLDFSGGSLHMTQSRATASTTLCTGYTTYLDAFHQAIGFDEIKNTVAGVDVSDAGPGHPFTISKTWPKDEIDGAWLRNMVALRWRTNAAPFYGAGVDEMRFCGCSMSLNSGNLWQIQFKFLWDVAGTQDINGAHVTIPPHHYMWIYYVMEESGIRRMMVPRQVMVERLFDPGDFSVLGL